MMPIITHLHNGDIVEIITSDQSKGPSRDWLKFVKSSSARNRINQWFKKAERSENIEKGKDILEKEVKKLGLKNSDILKQEWLQVVLDRYKFATTDDMYASIGFGGISGNKVMARLLEEYKKEHEEEDLEKKIEELVTAKPVKSKPSKSGIIVKGIDNCLVKLSKCCNPLPGDEIVGYVTKGRGVSVHRTDCVNVKDLLNEENRMIDVYWFDDVKGSYSVDVEIFANDRNGLLKDVIKQVENSNARLMGVNARTNKENITNINLTVEIENIGELKKLLTTLRNIESVYEVNRKRG
jgi:GTP pyrophosphokinase